MNLSKRNPLLRNAWEKGFNDTVGKLEDDIQQQDLEGIEGGSTPVCAVASVCLSVMLDLAYTSKNNCGYILTTSAECSRTGLPC